MSTEPIDKSHFFWSNDPKNDYNDHVPVPRVTYRCKGKVTREKGLRTTKHLCKFVTDHPKPYCECICGIQFNEKESVGA